MYICFSINILHLSLEGSISFVFEKKDQFSEFIGKEQFSEFRMCIASATPSHIRANAVPRTQIPTGFMKQHPSKTEVHHSVPVHTILRGGNGCRGETASLSYPDMQCFFCFGRKTIKGPRTLQMYFPLPHLKFGTGLPVPTLSEDWVFSKQK